MRGVRRNAIAGFVPATAVVATALSVSLSVHAQTLSFDTAFVTRTGPVAPWGKGVADINGDGLDDVLIAGHQPRRFSLSERLANKVGLSDVSAELGQLVWYQAPNWEPHIVASDVAFRTDVEAADIDGDKRADIVALSDDGVMLYTAPQWQVTRVAEGKFHDVELADVDADGSVDIVLRNQTLFGYNNADRVHVLSRSDAGNWQPITINVPQGEGLVVADMTGDEHPEIVVNDVFLQRTDTEQWQTVRYTTDAWTWPHVTIAVADFNSDGRRDIALAPAEEAGQTWRISWFEAPAEPNAAWTEHVVVAQTEAVHHALVAADFDRDGHIDLGTAQMNQSQDPDEVTLWRNDGHGQAFTRQIVGTDGSHNLSLLDADGDFDLDIIGANWQRDRYDGDYPVTLWRNTLPPRAWRRYVIDDARPGQAVAVLSADVNADGWADLLTGSVWYANPGGLNAPWPRAGIGDSAGNVVLADDLDGDGDTDVLSNGWAGYAKPTLMQRVLAKLGLAPDPWAASTNSLVFSRNDGQGGFDSTTVVARLPGDFVHGGVLDRSAERVLLSMHATDTPVVALSMPTEPDSTWAQTSFSDQSENEALSMVDMNGDGRLDVVTGSAWLDGATAKRTAMFEPTDPPDRHRVVDLDGDGQRDLVVGVEAPDRGVNVTWYELDSEGRARAEHVIGTLAGPMSLDVGDVDLDGDIDVVVGEHRLAAPELSRLVLFENLDGRARTWRAHRMSVGDEHHDGAHLVDLDGDGDLDVASIGWTHQRVLVFENPTVQQGPDGRATGRAP